jgi:MFS family permease
LYLPNIDPAEDLSFKEKMARQDWLGIVIFMGGATCLSLSLTFGGTVYLWSSAPEITLWTLSGVLLIVFLLVTIYHPTVTLRDRLYPLHLMKRLELNLLELALFMASGCMVTTLYYIPLLFQFTRNDGPLKAGARLMPLLAGLIFLSILNGVLMPKTGYYMPWYVAGTAMVLVGTALMSNISHPIMSRITDCKKVSSIRQPPSHIYMARHYSSEVAVELSSPRASQSFKVCFQFPSLAMP